MIAVFAVLLLSAELIAAWLVLKAASGWKGWGETPGVFNRFITGTSVSLAFGLGGGALAWGLSVHDCWLIAGGTLGPVVFGLLTASFYWGMELDEPQPVREPPNQVMKWWRCFWGIKETPRAVEPTESERDC
jgi:hypothetical protein